MSVTTLDLLRHGACEGGDILRGSTDDCLSDTGWLQMQNATSHNPGWQQIISSPMQRCQAFTQQLAQQLQLPLEVDQRWREIHFGIWEGRPIKQLWDESPAQMQQFFAAPDTFTPEGGEALPEFSSRIQSAFEYLLEAYQGQHLLVVQHGGTIKALLAMLFNLAAADMNKFAVPHAGKTRIKIYHQDDEYFPVLVSHNPEGIE